MTTTPMRTEINGVSLQLLDRLDALRSRKAQLDDEVKDVSAELGAVQEALVSQFAQHGLQNLKLTDGRTFYLQPSLWAYAKPQDQGGGKDAVITALRAEGMDDLVSETYNTSTLSAWVRERRKLGEPLPAGLDAVLDIVAKQEVRVRRS